MVEASAYNAFNYHPWGPTKATKQGPAVVSCDGRWGKAKENPIEEDDANKTHEAPCASLRLDKGMWRMAAAVGEGRI